MAIPGTHLISNEDFWDTHFQHLNVQEPDIAFAYLATVKCTKTRLEISKTITDVRSRHRELGISWSMSSSPDPPAGDPWLPPPSGILWEDDPRAQFRREMTCAATEAGVVVPRFLSLEGNSEEGSDNITCAPEHQIIPESLEPVKPFDVIKVESSPFKPIPTTPDTNTIHRVEGARISKVALRRGRAPEDVPTIKCPVDGCTKLYTTKAGLKYHTSNAHGKSMFRCTRCGDGFKGPASLNKHTLKCLEVVSYPTPAAVGCFAPEGNGEGGNNPEK